MLQRTIGRKLKITRVMFCLYSGACAYIADTTLEIFRLLALLCFTVQFLREFRPLAPVFDFLSAVLLEALSRMFYLCKCAFHSGCSIGALSLQR